MKQQYIGLEQWLGSSPSLAMPPPGQGAGEAGRWSKPGEPQGLSVSGRDAQPASCRAMFSSNGDLKVCIIPINEDADK